MPSGNACKLTSGSRGRSASPVLEDLASDSALLLAADLPDALDAFDDGALPIPRAELPEPGSLSSHP